MKAKLIKTIDGYHLRSLIKDIPRSINVYHKISKTEGEFGFGEHSGKLSKQNCDEIFGVVDEDKKNLYYYKQVMNPYETGGQSYTAYEKGFIEGFNKAMELNKDKVFSKGDMAYIMNIMSIHELSFEDAIIKFQSLQQPTEIEVVIEMECKIGCEHLVLNGENSLCCGNKVPKLDSEGCLILKKI
jgi:hypothetical protein